MFIPPFFPRKPGRWGARRRRVAQAAARLKVKTKPVWNVDFQFVRPVAAAGGLVPPHATNTIHLTPSPVAFSPTCGCPRSTLKTVIKRLQLIKRDDMGKNRPFIFPAKRPAAATDAGRTNKKMNRNEIKIGGTVQEQSDKKSVQVHLRLPYKINTGNKKVTTGHFCTIQVFVSFYFILIFALEICFWPFL